MKHKPVLRTPPGTGDLKIFSSEEGHATCLSSNFWQKAHTYELYARC
jgi:hypothetical protein